mmetsp:Transcript_26938/g.47968  ORF Transcript_26938/g.47968 Transcript_26938/m.47968 type:complete len:202 (+) Transcript_26938:193-798(+)
MGYVHSHWSPSLAISARSGLSSVSSGIIGASSACVTSTFAPATKRVAVGRYSACRLSRPSAFRSASRPSSSIRRSAAARPSLIHAFSCFPVSRCRATLQSHSTSSSVSAAPWSGLPFCGLPVPTLDVNSDDSSSSAPACSTSDSSSAGPCRDTSLTIEISMLPSMRDIGLAASVSPSSFRIKRRRTSQLMSILSASADRRC